jgi:hypothetical protein
MQLADLRARPGVRRLQVEDGLELAHRVGESIAEDVNPRQVEMGKVARLVAGRPHGPLEPVWQWAMASCSRFWALMAHARNVYACAVGSAAIDCSYRAMASSMRRSICA